MRQFILLLMTFMLLSCNKREPLHMDYGKIDVKKATDKLISRKVILEPDENSIYYRYYISTKSGKIPLEVTFNPDGYNLGKLRELKVSLAGDTTYLDYEIPLFERASVNRDRKDVDNVYRHYREIYGEPDSIYNYYRGLIEDTGNPVLDRMNSRVDLSIINPRKRKLQLTNKELDTTNVYMIAVWNTKDYRVIFNRPFLKTFKIKGKDVFMYPNNTYILYQMYDYDQELKRIRDSISSTYSPNDLVRIDIGKPVWSNLSAYKKRLTINLFSVRRKDSEEERSIRSIKYNINFKDSFGKLLYSIPDILYDFNPNLPNTFNGLMLEVFMNRQFIIDYNMNNNPELVFLEKYMELHDVNINVDVTSVLFSDGIVLKKL